ncbi:hypothetical protein SAMN05421548_1722 [Paraburkholderia lycopersici]|uniref:Uncharacterized protein n=1 Tax=Paraburkholderia lycopersici TaxID=416944 RepID=A0A1G7DP29_9BURK|nr:hypothetical protein SAMN05421548_1722 [Paraburkholderia lycopersici]
MVRSRFLTDNGNELAHLAIRKFFWIKAIHFGSVKLFVRDPYLF